MEQIIKFLKLVFKKNWHYTLITKEFILKKYKQYNIIETNKIVNNINSLREYMDESVEIPELGLVDENNLNSIKVTQKNHDIESITRNARATKNRIESAESKLVSIYQKVNSEYLEKLIPKATKIDVRNLKDVEHKLHSASVIADIIVFMSYKTIGFTGIDLYNKYNVNAHKVTSSYMSSPNGIANLGLAKMFGGAIGTAYAAQSIFNIGANSYHRAGIVVAVEHVRFTRRITELNNNNKMAIAIMYALKKEQVLTESDYKDALFSVVWNDGDCTPEGLGKWTTGAFKRIEMDEKDNFALSVAVKIISGKVIPLSQFNNVVSNYYSKLSPEVKSYLSLKYGSK